MSGPRPQHFATTASTTTLTEAKTFSMIAGTIGAVATPRSGQRGQALWGGNRRAAGKVGLALTSDPSTLAGRKSA
ncbi:MAG TPA: hypothetical protein VMV31_08830 [Terriglobales bacterium]|nr:hypothetical protein [Terriglobales bacterium]